MSVLYTWRHFTSAVPPVIPMSDTPSFSARIPAAPSGWLRTVTVGVAALMVLGVLVWQAVTAGGNPDPLAAGISPTAATLNTGVVVFREGLEAILVLAALTASMVRRQQEFWKPVALGAAVALVLSAVTWFVVVALINSIDAPLLHLQAATGILAILVLLVIMNWFFHKVYWTGWIGLHERRKRKILERTSSRWSVFWGLMAVGLTAVYREGFEVVVFLQSVRLQAGQVPVLQGAAIGLGIDRSCRVLVARRPAEAADEAAPGDNWHHDWRCPPCDGRGERAGDAAGGLAICHAYRGTPFRSGLERGSGSTPTSKV